MTKHVVYLCFLLLFSFPVLADTLEGYWETEDKDGIVEIYSCEEDALCGRFVWLKEDSAAQPSLDERNTNPDRKGRPLCGMTFLEGFRKENEGVYGGGWLYSPRHGSSFNATLSLTDAQTLVLRGYVFFPALGGEQTWKRAERPNLCWNVS